MEIELNPAQINNIVTASKLQRKKIVSRYINDYKLQLEAAANKLSGADQNAALDDMDAKVMAARDKIRETIKSNKKESESTSWDLARVSREAEVSHLKFLETMNIYVNGRKLDYKMLDTEINGEIDIKNPLPEILENQMVLAAYEGKATEGFKRNYDTIKEIIEDKLNTSDFVSLKNKFPVNKYLGAIDVSKKTNRIKVYNYWDEVGDKYEQFDEDLSSFFLAIDKSDLPDEIKAPFDKLYRSIGESLEYVVVFEDASMESLKARHRFFNLISYRLSLERLDTTHDGSSNYKDEISHGDIAAEFNAQIQESFGNSSTMGDTINMNELVPEVKWTDEYDSIMGAADPLLVYESNRGDKLLAITKEMEIELGHFLDGLEEAIKDEKGISLDTDTDIDVFMEQMDDTTTLDDGDLDGEMALPISVLRNVQFNDMYKEDTFPSKYGGGEIGLDQIDKIKQFFEDLYELLTDGSFMHEVQNRSSKGRGRGGKPDPMEARRMGFTTGSSESPLGVQSKGTTKDSFKKVQEELHKMLSSAIDYYFDPMYAGLMPIQVPNFASSIGSKVMQTLALDLGLETSMSKTYDTLFRLSAEEIDVGDLRYIADFLDNIFMPDVKISSTIITQGELAASALTEIFGKKEANNNYCAALIHHYMEDIGDTSREKKVFNQAGKTIAERAVDFNEMWTDKKAFPVFALPHWLDMNQGILTKASPASKKQYERLKEIFEMVQTDLPVLLHKLLKAHDAVRAELGKDVIYGYLPLNDYGITKMITKMQVDEDIDMSTLEVENIIKAVDSHDNISREYGISSEQVYIIKALFR